MAAHTCDPLDRAIPTALWRCLQEYGWVSLAFGLERGSLADLGVLVVRRVGRRPAGLRMTVEPGLRSSYARASS